MILLLSGVGLGIGILGAAYLKARTDTGPKNLPVSAGGNDSNKTGETGL